MVIQTIALRVVIKSSPFFKHFELRKQMGAKWQPETVWVKWCSWRHSQSNLSGDIHGQSQHRALVVRRPEVPLQREDLLQQIYSGFTDYHR